MNEPLTTHRSTAGRVVRRSEFTDFYGATYPAVTGELLALTGNLELAYAAAASSYTRAWQAWPAVRTLPWPAMWVRADGVRRISRPSRVARLLEHGLPPGRPVVLDLEDAVIVAGLQRLPIEQRLPLVLHYMGRVPADAIAEWFGGTVEHVDAVLDSAFQEFVTLLDWPDDVSRADPDTESDHDTYDWTAEALEDTALRLHEHFSAPSLAPMFRRTAAKTVARRGAPASAAAAACVGLVALLSPAPPSEAQASVLAGPPPVLGGPAGADASTDLPGGRPGHAYTAVAGHVEQSWFAITRAAETQPAQGSAQLAPSTGVAAVATARTAVAAPTSRAVAGTATSATATTAAAAATSGTTTSSPTTTTSPTTTSAATSTTTPAATTTSSTTRATSTGTTQPTTTTSPRTSSSPTTTSQTSAPTRSTTTVITTVTSTTTPTPPTSASSPPSTTTSDETTRTSESPTEEIPIPEETLTTEIPIQEETLTTEIPTTNGTATDPTDDSSSTGLGIREAVTPPARDVADVGSTSESATSDAG